jgi:antitoxin component YwqK of YwqJK toxin-antitoxin module
LKLSECNYVNGIKEGIYTIWFSDGNIKEISYFKNGLNHGKLIKYDDKQKNKIIEETEYSYGIIIYQNFNEFI